MLLLIVIKIRYIIFKKHACQEDHVINQRGNENKNLQSLVECDNSLLVVLFGYTVNMLYFRG